MKGSSMNTTATATRPYTRGRWTGLNIVLMIIGFALFWPLGLAMLAWIIWGDEIAGKAEQFKGSFRSFADRAPSFGNTAFGNTAFGGSGNVAFDDYRARELERLAEERRRLEEMRAEFEGFLKELRRVKDQEEFDRFMSSFRSRTDNPGTAGA
jgi:hypothetical protein